jgi:signal-transduction protein with cAMP-binding, CBS, and nucleotidyltransferase domain
MYADLLQMNTNVSICSGGIMPVNEEWRGSRQQWQERLDRMLQFNRVDWEKNILNMIALMDARFVCGDRDLAQGFVEILHSCVRNNTDAIRHMARVVSSMKLSRGFLNRFILETEGHRKGSFNLKLYAWMPLVMCVRFMAVSLGIEETSTLARLNRLMEGGHLTDKMTATLVDAYHTITAHRIRLQIMSLDDDDNDGCHIYPHDLTGDEQEILKIAISRIDELQHLIRSRFTMVTSADRILNLWS